MGNADHTNELNNAVLQIRLNKEVREKFKNICAQNGTKMADELKRYIYQKIKDEELIVPFKRRE